MWGHVPLLDDVIGIKVPVKRVRSSATAYAEEEHTEEYDFGDTWKKATGQ
jgi:hypothetical protein